MQEVAKLKWFSASLPIRLARPGTKMRFLPAQIGFVRSIPRAAPPHPAAVFQWLGGRGFPNSELQQPAKREEEEEEEEEEEAAKDMLRGFLTRSSAAMIFKLQLEVGGGGISRPPDPTS